MSKGVVVRADGVEEELGDEGFERALGRALIVYGRLKALEAELSALKGIIAQRAKEISPAGCVSFTLGGRSGCTVRPRVEAAIEGSNARKLRKILGRDFYNLVRLKKDYLPTRELLREEALREFVTFKELCPFFIWKQD